MASASIDIEDATQHLRDILKLDRPGGSVNENQRTSSSYNGDLNGLLVPDPTAAGDGSSLTKPVPQTVPLGALQDKQVICLSGDDNSTCMVILAKDVEIVASSDSSITSKARGSNKVKIQPVARYDWEQKYYYGNLIAVSNAYLAYAIRGASSGSAMVRVLSVSTAERTLLKGFTGGVTDLAFAHLNSNQLACLDEAGNLFVWCLSMENGKIQEEILVNIKRPDGTPLNNFRRIIWCPFIPDENEESCEEGSQTLALLHEDRAEVCDLDIIRANHSSWPVEVTNIKEGYIVVKGHSTEETNTYQKQLLLILQSIQEILGSNCKEMVTLKDDTDVRLENSQQMTMEDEQKIQTEEEKSGGAEERTEEINQQMSQADNDTEGPAKILKMQQRLSEGALSPDGTVLATASHDGYVKFWQIYIDGQDEPSRCLHEWKPHEGRPLSCLLFCDNHKKQDPEVPFWRFLITGADQNQELKMWCTVSWTCLQTIQFSPDIFSSVSVPPSLKVCLDLSAEYLILSDVQRKVLYVMELVQNQEEGKAYFSSISEFLLTHPVLSFGIQMVSRCRLRHTEVLSAEEESDGISAEGAQGSGASGSAAGVLIKLFCVHTKALQDVQIRFQPLHSPDTVTPVPPHGSREDFAFPDHLADIGMEGRGSEKGSIHGSQPDLRRISELSVPVDFLPPSNDTKPKLMTPDAFMTPSTSLQQLTGSPGSSSISSLTTVTTMSSASVGEPSLPRPSEDMSLSPKMQLDANLALSGSSGSLQASPRNHSVLLPGLPDKLTPKVPIPVSPGNPPSLALEQEDVEPLVVPQSSPTRERSPDVISSASTAMSQDIPEIASETLQRSFGAAPSGLPVEILDANHHTDSMASAASALHLLSPRNRHSSEPSHHSLDMAPNEVDMLTAPSLLEAALPQENVVLDSGVSQPWPAAPDITRETRNSMADSPRNEVEEKHKSSCHRHTYRLLQHDSQDASAEQSDHDDEVASLATASGGFTAKVTAQRLPVKDWKAKVSPRASPKLKRKGKKDDRDATQSPRSFDQQGAPEYQEELMSLLRTQQREIAELRQNQMELMQRLADHLDAVQSSLMGHIERVIDSQQEQEQRRLEQALSEGQQRSGQLQEHLSQQLSQSLSTAACNRLERTIREEMKKSLPPCVSKSLDPITGQLSNTIANKLTAVEGTLKENIAKLVKSKNLTDTIARAATDTLQVPMQTAFREAFQSIVLPAFEKSCQSMFQQINDTFKQGTQEYVLQLEAQLKNKKAREQEARDSLLGQLRQMVSSFQSTTDQMASTITASVHSELQHQLHVIVGNMQESILAQVQRVIKGEVSTAMKEQQAAVTSSIMQAMRSAAGTPIPATHLDFQSQQAHMLQLLQQGHLNQAFQQALTAADLNLVLYVCETVDPQQVFGQDPCPLSQPVLLSLIQQLSSDLGSRTELKLNYLEEAVMHLDHSDPITRDHMGSVMNQVRQKLFQFLQVEPHNSVSKPARRLMIMLQGLVTHSMS